MVSFTSLVGLIAHSYTGRSLKSWIRAAGLRHPREVTSMYLRGESPEYIAAACLAIETIGA